MSACCAGVLYSATHKTGMEMKLFTTWCRSPQDVADALKAHREFFKHSPAWEPVDKCGGTMSDGWIRLNFSKIPEEIAAQIQKKASRINEVLFSRVQSVAFMLQSKVVAKLSGEVLKVRTGVLRSSVTANTTTDGIVITGTVEAGKGASHSYAMIHTLGHEGAYRITATRAKALAFQLSVKEGARTIFAKSVLHPAIAAKPFMADTLAENRQQIIDELAADVARVLKEK